jgi:hypothetical protein
LPDGSFAAQTTVVKHQIKVGFLVLPTFLLLSGLTVFAQGNVRLNGKVLNQRNQPVAGATVVVKDGRPTAANVEGEFLLALAPGTYELTVSAVGYKTKSVSEVEIRSDIENFLEIILEDKKAELEEVVVRSSRKQENTNALLTFQKKNTALSSGLAADFIRRTPDKNTGEVLRRVSGASIQDNKFVVVRGLSDRYNSAMINGALLPSTEPDKKAFSFDVVPSALIDNIIINKTATPEMTGEFTGGLIQITTKDIPTKNQVSFGIGLGFNTQSFGKDFVRNRKGGTDWLGFDDGQRDLPGSYPLKFGDYNRLPQDQQYAVSQAFNDEVFAEETTTAGPIQTYNVTWSNATRNKKGHAFGSVLGLNYRNAKLLFPRVQRSVFETGGINIFNYNDAQNRYSTNWGGVFNLAYSFGKTKIAWKNLFNQNFEDNYYRRTGINNDNLQDISLRSSFLNQRSLYSTQGEVTHTFANKWKFVGNVNYSLNQKDQPDLRVQTYAKPIGSSNPFSLNNRGNNTNRFWSDLTDQALGFQGKMELPFSIGKNKDKQLVSVGGGTLLRVRDFQAIILGIGDPGSQSIFQLPFDQIFRKENFNPNGGFQYVTDLQNIVDKYFGASVLSNGFVQFDNKIGENWRIVWGARVENFQQVVDPPKKGPSDTALDVDTDKWDFLPSANITYSLNNKTNIRFGLSRTVARPEFREVAPFAFFNFEDLASVSGNPSLRRSSIINVDARYEYYPKAGEVLSAGVFYKTFKDPIELRLLSNSGPSLRVYQFQNAIEANLYGVEFEFRKSLGFLDSREESWLDNVYFNGNVSFIYSQVSLLQVDPSNPGGESETTLDRPLQGQSPYLINAGFQYNGPTGLNMSLLYNIIGQRLTFVGNQSFGDIYEKPRHLVDFQISKRVMKKKGEVRLTIGDIINQNFILYEKPIFKDKTAYDDKVDRIFTRYKFGTTFTLGFNYDLNL